jgi:nitric oxide reductase activation protein
VSSAPFPPAHLKQPFQTLRILINVDQSIVELYFSQRLEGLDRSAVSYEDEVIALLGVAKIIAGEDAELYARSVRDVISPARARGEHNALRSSQVLERAVEDVLSSLRDGETLILFSQV